MFIIYPISLQFCGYCTNWSPDIFKDNSCVIQVNELSWNLDSSVLMVWLEDLVEEPTAGTTPKTYGMLPGK